MFKVNDKVKCTAVGSLNRDTVFTVKAVGQSEWLGEKITDYTITDGITTATVTEDVVYRA